ncbi:MAG: hypothetical protein BGO12_06975 [Verrucomicrobia bacterium 61-8]|nr:methyl-accepting chemotaxis protein [Verrucomicrobiota bacterium]OJV01392.1 MAG: hypothetical protein BGO12_06975 [Verrucomicrobia bacterium 61-8]
MRWTINRQIAAGYAISLLFVIALGVTAYWTSHQMLDAFNQRRNATQIIIASDQILNLVQDAENGQRGYLLTGAEPYLEPYRSAVSRLPSALDTLKRLVEKSVIGQEGVAELQMAVSDNLAELARTIDLRRASQDAAALQIVNQGAGKEAMERIRQRLDAIKQAQLNEQVARNDEAQGAAAFLLDVLAIGIPLSVGVMIFSGIVTSRRVLRPVEEITEAARLVSEGDLEVKLPEKSKLEEIHALTRSFERMVASLRQSANLSERLASGDLTVEVKPLSDKDVVGKSQAGMVTKLSDLIEQVQRSGVQVNSSAVQIAAASKQQQSTASEMASTTTEISATSREISVTAAELLKAADNMNEVCQRLVGLAVDGKEGLQRMDQVMRHIIDASVAITARFGEMNDRAGTINSVVTTITKVADQTNLLSLNAAIEAEKAGEYGRGFSVVASEIRRLADQTAASTLDIEQMVKEMLASVSAGVMGMDKFSEEVRRNAHEVTDVTRQIDGMIEQVQLLAPSVESVYEGMRTQTQGSAQISEALVQLGDAARQTADAIRDSNRAVEQLNEATGGLQKAVSRFKLR